MGPINIVFALGMAAASPPSLAIVSSPAATDPLLEEAWLHIPHNMAPMSTRLVGSFAFDDPALNSARLGNLDSPEIDPPVWTLYRPEPAPSLGFVPIFARTPFAHYSLAEALEVGRSRDRPFVVSSDRDVRIEVHWRSNGRYFVLPFALNAGVNHGVTSPLPVNQGRRTTWYWSGRQ